MNRKEFLSLLPKVILLALAIIMIFFGLFPNFLNGEFVTYEMESPQDKSMPEDGYLTPVYDPMTLVSIQVSASSNVEVQVYSSAYIKGKVIKDSNNVTVTRETWLAAGDDDERIGRDLTLREFSHSSAQYRIFVYEPDGSIPSETDYTVKVNVYTIDMTFIAVGLLFYTIFVFLGIMEYLKSVNRMLKAGVAVRDESAEAADLEALLETAPAPMAVPAPAPPEYRPPPPAPSPEPAPAAPTPPSYEQMYGAPAAPPPRAPPAPPAYQPPPPPSAPPAYQPPPPPQAPPAYQPPAPAPAPAPEPAPAPPAAREPVSKVRCPACKSIVPVYTAERPTPIECPTCGKKGMIR